MAFIQDPPRLANSFRDDRVLRSYLARAIPDDMRREIAPVLDELGEDAAGRLYELQLADRLNEPRLVQWDAWGNRVDRIELTPLWQEAKRLAAKYGLVAVPYEKQHGEHARLYQAALIHLFNPSSDIYTCPLAMTDGATKTLLAHGNQALIDRAFPRLTSRDAAFAWTSGQWMTERTGGSDVGISETIARVDADGSYRLHGTKWFTSAATSEMALTLARPEGNGPGGRGLALFYLETRDAEGRMNGIQINRLKDKLGTRKLPTAELTLEGTRATPVSGLVEGVRAITPMLNVTRFWNSVSAISTMRRGIALARDYSRRRHAFGSALSQRPLHIDTLAGLQAEFEAAFHLVMEAATLLGREEASTATDDETQLLRLITPLAKLTTGKQVVAILSEVVECFGGAGYVEDTGIPALFRDAQVLPIWEGTTNVLSLDALRTVAKEGSLLLLIAHVEALGSAARDPKLAELAGLSLSVTRRAAGWAKEEGKRDALGLEAGARRFALTLGRSLALAALVRHAQWSLDHEHDGRARAAAIRFARHGVDLLGLAADRDAALALANDEPLAG